MTGKECWGWRAFRQVEYWPLTNISIVEYMTERGARGAEGYFFRTKSEAAQAAMQFGWREAEFSRVIMPSARVGRNA